MEQLLDVKYLLGSRVPQVPPGRAVNQRRAVPLDLSLAHHGSVQHLCQEVRCQVVFLPRNPLLHVEGLLENHVREVFEQSGNLYREVAARPGELDVVLDVGVVTCDCAFRAALGEVRGLSDLVNLLGQL